MVAFKDYHEHRFIFKLTHGRQYLQNIQQVHKIIKYYE